MHLEVLDREERRLGGGRGLRPGSGVRARRSGAGVRLLGEMAGRPLHRADRAQGRVLGGADRAVAPDRAAWLERAARRQVRGRRRLAGDRIEPRLVGVDARDALEQGGRVGVARLPEDRLHGPGLDDAAAIHHGDPVGDLRDDAEVVRDEDHGRAGLGLAPRQHGEHLGLHGDVERGRGLVRDDELRPARHRHGDHGALAHAAGELVRVLPGTAHRIRDVDLAQELDRPRPRLGGREAAMGDLALRDLPADGQDRIEGRGGILEDEADILGAQAPQGFGSRGRHLGAAEADRAAHARGLRQESRDRERGHALARPRFPTMPSTSSACTSKSMPRTAGTGRPEPTKATSSPRTDRMGSPRGGSAAAVIRLWIRSIPPVPSRASSGFEPDGARDQHVVDVVREAVHVLGRDDQAGVVGVGRDREGRLDQHLVEVS
jgi:hypothetical protein